MPKIKRKMIKNENLLFNDFIVEKEANGLAKKSIENYVKVYERYCKEIGEEISKKSVLKWIKFLSDKGLDSISINFYIVQLRVFAYVYYPLNVRIIVLSNCVRKTSTRLVSS